MKQSKSPRQGSDEGPFRKEDAGDITVRRQADLAPLESESRYRAMVEALDGLIYICSLDYRIEFMNPRLIERTGYDGTGEYCYKVLHDHRLRQLRRRLIQRERLLISVWKSIAVGVSALKGRRPDNN